MHGASKATKQHHETPAKYRSEAEREGEGEVRPAELALGLVQLLGMLQVAVGFQPAQQPKQGHS